MGRNVKMRPNYRADSAFLQRLIGAIEIDPRIPLDTKRTLMQNMREASVILLSIPTDIERGRNVGND